MKTSFYDDVYSVVRLIPKGRITSYGVIASYLGTKSSSCMVGWVMNNAYIYLDVSAHRVVNWNGLLTGKHHFNSSTHMQELLEAEGVIIKNNQVVEFDKLFWNPFTEL